MDRYAGVGVVTGSFSSSVISVLPSLGYYTDVVYYTANIAIISSGAVNSKI